MSDREILLLFAAYVLGLLGLVRLAFAILVRLVCRDEPLVACRRCGGRLYHAGSDGSAIHGACLTEDERRRQELPSGS